MNINKKWLSAGIALLIIVWTANIIFYENHVLKEPMFMRHYYNLTHVGNMQIHYVQNKTDNLRIHNLSFPELGDFPVRFQETKENSLDRYYNMKTIMVELNKDEFEKKYGSREVLITRLNVQFSNGKTMSPDIGNIYISSHSYNDRILEWSSGSSSSNNTGYTILRTKETTIIKGIESKFSELFLDMANVKLNGKPLNDLKYPIELPPADNIEISHAFSFDSKDDIRKLYYLQMSPQIVSETKDGKSGIDFIHIHYRPYLKSGDIKRLKDERGMN